MKCQEEITERNISTQNSKESLFSKNSDVSMSKRFSTYNNVILFFFRVYFGIQANLN